MLLELALLFAAGVLGGIMNSIAGGGSFITFPALMAVGVPPIMANATNTYAACAGYISGAVGFREEILKKQTRTAIHRLVQLSWWRSWRVSSSQHTRVTVFGSHSLATFVCYAFVSYRFAVNNDHQIHHQRT